MKARRMTRAAMALFEMANLAVWSYLLLAPQARAADNIITDGAGSAYLVDNSNNLWPLDVGYTTDGNSGLLSIMGAAVAADDLVVPKNSGKAYLRDTGGRLFPASVLLTTDGNSNVIPVAAGGGGGAAWGSITGTLSNQTDLQTALDGKQSTGSYITSLTGDVTAAGPGAAAATIANLAVTNAKIADGTIDLTAKVTGELPVVNQASQPHTQVVWVDKNRVDSYTADGSLTRPYKTIKAAVDGATCTASLKCEFRIAPGTYVEDNALAFKEWQYIIGASRDTVTISRANASAVVIDFTANVSHRMAIHNVTFTHGLTVDRSGDTTGGANVDLVNVWVGGAFTYNGRGSGVDFLNARGVSITGATTLNGVSGILNQTNLYGAANFGTTGATQADAYSYYSLISMQGSYIAGNLTATVEAAKPAGYQLFQTMGDGSWVFNATGSTIDLYIDGSSGSFQGSTYTKTGAVTTYRYGNPSNIWYNPVSANWTATVPTNVKDALDKIASGDYSTQGVKLATSGAQPTCNASNRGRLWVIQGGAGVADQLQVCLKDAADVYAWVTK